MRFNRAILNALCATVSISALWSGPAQGAAEGWTNWRGPAQNGTSTETGLPEQMELGGPNHLWTYELSGRGAPVIANGQVYVLGYRGEGPDLQELIVALDAETGAPVWEHGFNDFLSDIVYSRYSIGAPVVDRETGNVYLLTAAGIFACFSGDGRLLWQHSMMDEYGRLTFPNGRTGAPIIDDDLVIIHSITSNWGADGPARDRFYAFDKKSGQVVWSSTPGAQPQDSSFSTPVTAWQNGKRVLYCGTGCGNIICLNARTGDPLWRYQSAKGGFNPSVILHKDKVIAIQNDENTDSSDSGRMTAVKVGTEPAPGQAGPVELTREAEAWRNPLASISSSPVLVGDRIYQVNSTGELCCVHADTGEILWRKKLAPAQLHSSPLYADGKLYVPMQDGALHVLRPSDQGAEELGKVQLEGECLGAPGIWNGKIYVHTTAKLYCFGSKEGGHNLPAWPAEEKHQPGPAAKIQVVPSEILMFPGQSQSFSLRVLDANGLFVSGLPAADWKSFIPPTAKVKSTMDAHFDDAGNLVTKPEAKTSAGAFEAVSGGIKGIMRGRLIPSLPIQEDFERFELNVPNETEPGVQFAYPPLPWIGARFKWEVRELEGNKVLAKTLDNMLFQRAMTFIGGPAMKNYTIQADVMTDGNRRTMSPVGVINQRYIIALVGNWQQIEVSSNHDRVKVGVPFKVKPKTWYRLKSRVDVAADGSGVVRAKAWPREEPEPEAWTIEVPHKKAHECGAPGLFGFSLQNQFRVYIDNVMVTAL
jgi:outer membrane protein assembly factor BamB